MPDSTDNFIRKALAGGPSPDLQSAGGNIKVNSGEDQFIEDALGMQGGASERGTASRLAGATKNLGTGAIKEIDNIFYGPIVTAIQAFDPALAKQLSDKVNAPTPLTSEDPSAPIAYGAGRVGGGIAALTGLGVNKFLSDGSMLMSLLKGATVGGFMGGTELKDDPQALSQRMHDAIWGALGGAAGTAVTETARAALAKAVNSMGVNRFLRMLAQSVGGLAAGDVRLKTTIQGSFDALNRIKRSMFNLRDTTGKEIGQVPSEDLSQALTDFRSSLKSSSVSSRIDPVLRKVEDRLVTNPEDETIEMPMLGGKKLDPRNPSDMIIIQKYKEAIGKGKNQIPQVVSAEQVFAALSDVNKALRTTKDVAAKTQLGMLKNILMEKVKDISSRAGGNPNQLVARWEQANQFFKDRIVPYRKVFGMGEEGAITGDMTAKGVNDWAVKTFESGDPEKIATMMKIAGGRRGQQALTRIFMNHALDQSVSKDGTFNPAKVLRYFNENKEAIKSLPLDLQNSITGFSKMLNRSSYEMHALHGAGNWMILFGGYEMARGEFKHGASMVGMGIGAKLALRSFEALFNSARGNALLQAASKLPADSPKLTLLLQRAAPLIGTVTGEQAGEAVP